MCECSNGAAKMFDCLAVQDEHRVLQQSVPESTLAKRKSPAAEFPVPSWSFIRNAPESLNFSFNAAFVMKVNSEARLQKSRLPD